MKHVYRVILLIGAYLWRLSELIIKPKKIGSDAQLKIEEKRGRFNKEFYKKIKRTKFNIRSHFGYFVSCELFQPKEWEVEEGKIAILSHGFGRSKYGCLVYGEMYLKKGYRVIMYDHRNHGSSGKAYTSMGYYEKYDLKQIVDWCYGKYGDDCRIVTHGESMGAATVLLHLAIDDRVKCVVADCGYSDLTQLLKHQIKVYYHLPKFLIKIESVITNIRAGFRYSDVSPIKAVAETDIPILFIHGKRDRYVPTYMSKEMYKTKKGEKAIYLVSGAKHTESYMKNKKGYEEKVENFINKYM